MSVRNGLALFLALSALTFLAACGGSSSPRPMPPPGGGFSAGNLNGTYVFSSTGFDSSGAFFTIAGSVIANGTGGITGGTLDVNGFNTGPLPNQAISSGSYTVTPDGRGRTTLQASGGTITLDFVLTSSSHGLVTEFDNNGTGSGTIDLQTAVTSLAQLAGSYAFSLSGVDPSGSPNPFATAGSFTLDQNGNITGGIQDFNDNGIPYLAVAVNPTGPAILGSGTGPGTIAINTTTFGTLTFDFYAVDATHLKFIEIDSLPILSGDVFTQTGASIPTGAMVFTMAGLDSSGPFAAGGVMNSPGGGNLTGGLEDLNNAGQLSTAQIPFTGTAAAAAGVGGRVLVNLSGFVPVTQIAVYPSSGGVLFLETDSLGISGGAAYAQKSTTLATSGYGLNLTGSNPNGEEDDIAEFTTTGTSFSGIVDLNDQGFLTFDKAFNGSYNSPDGTGRGSASTNYFTYDFYVVDSGTFLLLETDSGQVGIGTFESQNAAAAAGAAQSAVSMFHPAVRAHAALGPKRK